ncbi:aminotransferase class IV [Streptomyces sp. NPDC058953]|uniref:aminotransferase class IV n=1 Tax=unclassified Streptomyces TaxID=2593676 RepID=UPI003685EAED
MATLDDRPVTPDELAPLAMTSYGHFTTMRVEPGGRVKGLSLHLERLVRDSAVVFGVGVDTDGVRERVRRAVEGRDAPCVVRLTHYDPGISLVRPVDAVRPRLLVTVRGAGAAEPAAVRVGTVAYERELPEVKHCGLFGALHARREAQLAGYDDALFTGRDGLVSEGPTWNAGFVEGDGNGGGTVVWAAAPVLDGVTMALLRRGVAHRVGPVTPDDARGMRAAFLTNAAVGVRAVAAIDGTEMDTGHPVLGQLREAYGAVPEEVL